MATSPAPPGSPTSGTATVHCARCRRPDAPALAKPPLYGPQGKEIQARVCADCWGEWQRGEVMVINELRLNFMDPAAQDILTRHMREFLFLDAAEGEPEGGSSPRS
jgi:Fe-S cluster biosynthesis and repair protein YggX